MSHHVPTTAQVRRAYITGMRQAFIASEGEHGEEFDRWFARRKIAKQDQAHAATRVMLAQTITAAIGYEPTRVSLSPGVGGLTHRTAEDRDWLVSTITDAILAPTSPIRDARVLQAEQRHGIDAVLAMHPNHYYTRWTLAATELHFNGCPTCRTEGACPTRLALVAVRSTDPTGSTE